MRSNLKDAQSNFANALAGAKALGLHECAEKAQEGLTRVTRLQSEKRPQIFKDDNVSSADDQVPR